MTDTANDNANPPKATLDQLREYFQKIAYQYVRELTGKEPDGLMARWRGKMVEEMDDKEISGAIVWVMAAHSSLRDSRRQEAEMLAELRAARVKLEDREAMRSCRMAWGLSGALVLFVLALILKMLG